MSTLPAVNVLGHHVILRLGDDRVIAPSRAERRRWARRLCSLARDVPIVAWKLADTHLHLVVLTDRAGVDALVRRLRIWVTSALRPGVSLEVQRTKPLSGQSHLEAAFHYALRQDIHHGVETDLMQDASALPDILGLRVLSPELPLRVREHLPRLRRDALLAHLAVPALEVALHAEHLLESALAAFAIDAMGLDKVDVQARRAAIAAAAGLGPTRIADLLGVTPQAVCRLARAPVSAPDVRAVRLQMALRAQLSAAVPFAREPQGPVYRLG